MPGRVPRSSSKSSTSSEDQASTLWMDTPKLLGWELVSKTAAIGVPSIEGGGNAAKEGK
jgi:hypothetical protein